MTDVRVYEGRLPCGGVQNDGSRWASVVVWHDASSCCPVSGYPVLLAKLDGSVVVLDLRRRWREDGAAEDFEETRALLRAHSAKWWAYMPLSPPVNVLASPIGASGASAVEASDPPREDWIVARNLPVEIVGLRDTEALRLCAAALRRILETRVALGAVAVEMTNRALRAAYRALGGE